VTTAEPIEIMTTVLGLFALVASLYLLRGAVQTARLAVADGRCEAVQTLAWGRVENEAMRGVLVLLVLIAGVSQMLTPMPVAGSPLRWWFQLSWALIAALNLVMSLRNERRIRHVVEVIERERKAGRMGSK